MPKENITRYAILGMVSHAPMTGYDIKKRIENSIGYFWNAGFGQIYPELRKLEDQGLITKSEESSDKGPNRKVYTITETGQEELRDWLMLPVKKETIRFEVLLKLFFGRHIPIPSSIEHIKSFKERSEENLKVFDGYEETLRESQEDEDHFFFLTTVLFGKYTYQACSNWASDVLEMFEEKQKKS
ncbi:MAG: PadR family transcriptional regulator [bacterium]|nr:PadR family transcriptional regulator [bacterium]